MSSSNVIVLSNDHFKCHNTGIKKITADSVVQILQDHNKDIDFMINDRLEEIEILRERQDENINLMEQITCQTL